MSSTTARDDHPIQLLKLATCPHCWEQFAPEQALWISQHVELLGDPLLGPDQQSRFLPTRFTIEGDAYDPRGMVSRELACPRCHLGVPRAMLELEPLFLSILGAPASGKSFYLAAATWKMRQSLPHAFRVALTDTDMTTNRGLAESEELLFQNPQPRRVIPLGSLIRKTELQGELYDTVAYGQHTVSYPRPLLFTVRPLDGHPSADQAHRLGRVVCLYDNAGEHFQPGQDTASSPVTRHLARSRALLFLFDPTQDQRFREACKRAGHPTDEAGNGSRLSRQETILNEVAARVRSLNGLPSHARHDRPLIVVLSKYDAWSHLIDLDTSRDPWAARSSDGLNGLLLQEIEDRSARLRALLTKLCPELVGSAESFAKNVTYIASSALGPHIEIDPTTGRDGIRPEQIAPIWSAVPLLYALAREIPGLIPRAARKNGGSSSDHPKVR